MADALQFKASKNVNVKTSSTQNIIVWFCLRKILPKDADEMANNADHYQTAPTGAAIGPPGAVRVRSGSTLFL